MVIQEKDATRSRLRDLLIPTGTENIGQKQEECLEEKRRRNDSNYFLSVIGCWVLQLRKTERLHC